MHSRRHNPIPSRINFDRLADVMRNTEWQLNSLRCTFPWIFPLNTSYESQCQSGFCIRFRFVSNDWLELVCVTIKHKLISYLTEFRYLYINDTNWVNVWGKKRAVHLLNNWNALWEVKQTNASEKCQSRDWESNKWHG